MRFLCRTSFLCCLPSLISLRPLSKPFRSATVSQMSSPNDDVSSSSSSSPSSVIDFLTLCHRLKTTKRAGWVKREVIQPESIADHMYRMGLMGLIASDIPGIDRDKCVKMAIVHDIAEDGVPKLEKNRREQEALDHMCKLLGGGCRAKEICDLWMEYEENSTPEAKMVKDFDIYRWILRQIPLAY